MLSSGGRFQAMAQALVANFEVRGFEAVGGDHQPSAPVGACLCWLDAVTVL